MPTKQEYQRELKVAQSLLHELLRILVAHNMSADSKDILRVALPKKEYMELAYLRVMGMTHHLTVGMGTEIRPQCLTIPFMWNTKEHPRLARVVDNTKFDEFGNHYFGRIAWEFRPVPKDRGVFIELLHQRLHDSISWELVPHSKGVVLNSPIIAV